MRPSADAEGTPVCLSRRCTCHWRWAYLPRPPHRGDDRYSRFKTSRG